MSDKMEHIPERIFDLIEKRSFDELPEQEQTEVLHYLSRGDYDALHKAALAIKNPVKDKSMRKGALLSVYDSQHLSPVIRAVPVLWKAAAVFFLVCSAVLFFYVMKYRQISELSAANNAGIRDTVYVLRQKMNRIEKIIDTVYLTEPSKLQEMRKVALKESSAATRIGKVKLQEEELEIMTLEELNSEPNRRKGNSVKDDTLMKKYSFVSTL